MKMMKLPDINDEFNDENGIKIHYNTILRNNEFTIVSNEEDFDNEDLFYTWAEIWEEYDCHINGSNSS